MSQTTEQQELKSFFFVFQITPSITFEVQYYRLGGNKEKDFSTSANEFNRPKTDYDRCGQAQKELLIGKAMGFYKKWNQLHLKDLTQEQHSEILADIEQLKEVYNFGEFDHDPSFEENKSVSKMKIKKVKK